MELLYCSEVLEIMIIRRDLSTEAAETASKQQLKNVKSWPNIKRSVESYRPWLANHSHLMINDQWSSVVSSLYVDSVIDSQFDSRERLNTVSNVALKMSKLETGEYEPSCSNSRVLALIATLSETANKTPSATSDDVPHDSLNFQNTLVA